MEHKSNRNAYQKWLDQRKEDEASKSQYHKWAVSVGIMADSEGQETWDHQQEKIDMLTNAITAILLHQGDCRDIASKALVKLSELNELKEK